VVERDRLPLLARLVYSDWDEGSEAMGFEEPWGLLLEKSLDLAARITENAPSVLRNPASAPAGFYRDSLELYVRLPAIINVVLNWKICLEQGLPLHPTRYFEVNESTRGKDLHPPEDVRRAQEAFLAALALAGALVALDPQAPVLGARLRLTTGRDIGDFVFTSLPDKYTWRACDPAKILTLAARIETSRGGDPPAFLVGAAHGSLLPGLVLAGTLGLELYYLRFSMFKRKDQVPVVGDSDLAWLAARRDRPALLFDEDVAKGRTMEIFRSEVAPLLGEVATAAVIRHGLSAFRPDFVGLQWFD